MSRVRLLWPLIPAGRCRLLLLAAAALSKVSALVALVPALVVYVIALVIFNHIDIGLNVMQVVFAGIASVIARLGLLLLARNTAGSAVELLGQELRGRAAVTIGALPLGVLGELPAGSLETMLLDDVETLGHYVSDGLIDLAGALAMLFVAAVVLALADWRAAAAAAALACVAALAVRGRSRRAAAQVERERMAREAFSAAIFGAVRSLALTASLPATPEGVHPGRTLADEDRRAADIRLGRAATVRARRAAVASALPAAAVLCAAALHDAGSSLPVLVLFAALGMRVSGALSCVLRADATAAPALESAGRLRALLDRPALPQGTTPLPVDTTLRFAGVSFAYPGTHGWRSVLHDIDFTAPAGCVTAIVGPSGSGKTTLTRLAARLWDVDSGSVTLGGVDVRAMPLDALMQRVSCVFQDVALLDDTVAANLKLGRPDAPDDAVVSAAAAAGADAFIRELPAGYATIIGDRGLQLSRGERQRLQIARALLKDAPVVILDEPTSSMDPATELEIQTALAPLFAGKTVLVVAHRLATVLAADWIIVMGRDGRVEAQGRHADLLADSPTYARLWSDYRAAVA